MDVTTTTKALQALLDQSEDEIIKPKRSTTLQRHITLMRRSWERYVRLFVNSDGFS